MSVHMRLREAVLNNKKLYVLSRVLQQYSTEQFYELLWGFYEYTSERSTLLVEHPGESNPGEIVYYITHGVEPEIQKGFFAVMRFTLVYLHYADSQFFAPVVHWGKYNNYYDPEMDEITKNVFEYYFEPTSHICYEDILHCRNLVRTQPYHVKKIKTDFGDLAYSYVSSAEEIQRLADLYKKYCRPNKKTRIYLKNEITGIINNKRTLGVHVRGTDYGYQVANHPIIIKPEEFLEETLKQLSSGKYEQVFLATDDIDVLELFKSKISENQLVYFQDTLRGSGLTAPFESESTRPLNKYKLGLEVLRDAYTLAVCDGLVCGLSQVGLAARYINLTISKPYDDCLILDKGVLKKSSKIGKKQWKKWVEEEKQLKKVEENEHRKDTEK